MRNTKGRKNKIRRTRKSRRMRKSKVGGMNNLDRLTPNLDTLTPSQLVRIKHFLSDVKDYINLKSSVLPFNQKIEDNTVATWLVSQGFTQGNNSLITTGTMNKIEINSLVPKLIDIVNPVVEQKQGNSGRANID